MIYAKTCIVLSSTISRYRIAIEGLAIYASASLVVWGGVLFAQAMVIDLSVDSEELDKCKQEWTLLEWATFRDGAYYEQIANEGYRYYAGQFSNLAFFPAYPLLTRGVMAPTGLSAKVALLVVSNAAGLIAIILLAVWLRMHQTRLSETAGRLCSPIPWPLVILAFFPAGLFLRVAYSEAVCLAGLMLFCVGIAKCWHPAVVAAVAGAVSAVRPVGVAAMLPALMYAWRRSSLSGGLGRVTLICVLAPLSCWGLLAFMGCQALAFDDPLAFTGAQIDVQYRDTSSLWQKATSLITLEPIWSAYIPGLPGYWRNVPYRGYAPFDLQWMNPLYFVVTAAAVVYAFLRRLIDVHLFVLGGLLVSIPYVTRAYELCMGSQGRFMLMVVPAYIGLGDMLSRLPLWVAMLLVIGAAILLFSHTALFAAGYSII